MYKSEYCKVENNAIKVILNKYIKEGDHILDIGCGSGLGKRLLKNKNYIGIDKSYQMVTYCKERHNNGFYNETSEKYINNINQIDSVISLFSLNYMKPSIIKKIYEKQNNVFIAVHYNKPYKSKDSIYYKNKILFLFLHLINQIRIKRVLKKLNATTFNLLNSDYYYVSVLKK